MSQDNPYSSPEISTSQATDPRARLAIPAIALMVLATLGFLGMVTYAVFAIIGLSLDLNEMPTPESDAEAIGQKVGMGIFFIGIAINSLLQVLIFYGGLCMFRRRAYPLAIAASIAAMVPFISASCCFISIPFGIWAIVVLIDPSVRQNFTR